jgi:hypothetical protein
MTPGGRDDEVTFGGRRVDFEGTEQAPDIRAPFGALDEGKEPLLQTDEGGARPVPTGPDGRQGHLVANTFEALPDRLRPQPDVEAGRFEGKPGPQRGGHCIAKTARLRQRDTQGPLLGCGRWTRRGSHRRRDIEAPPDERREPLRLDRTDPARVEGDLEQLIPVGDRLPQRHRRRHVAGQGVSVGLRRGVEGGIVDGVELTTPFVDPPAQIGQVAQGLTRRHRHPETSRRRGRATGPGPRTGSARRRREAKCVVGAAGCRARGPGVARRQRVEFEGHQRPYTGLGGDGALPKVFASQAV